VDYIMDTKPLYETIMKRKSVRAYENKSLNEAMLAEITAFISEIKPFYPDIQTEIKIVTPIEGAGIIGSKAAYHAIIFSEEKEGFQENAGFMLQQLDLWLSAKGIGTCWRGAPQLKGSILKLSSLKYIIMLAVGYPAEAVHRERIEEFDRKSSDEIWNVKGLDAMIEPVRLAPSGMNRQPWLFVGSMEEIDVFCSKRNIITNKFLGNMDRISIGIALCHLWLATDVAGKKMELIPVESGTESMLNTPKGYYHVVSVKII
jgi:hypothetical protein